MAEPRNVVAQRIKDISGRRVVLIDKQNDCSAKVLMSLGYVRDARSILGDDVFDGVSPDSAGGSARGSEPPCCLLGFSLCERQAEVSCFPSILPVIIPDGSVTIV